MTEERLRLLKRAAEFDAISLPEILSLIEEIQCLRLATKINHEDFVSHCKSENIRPARCCAPNYCVLAPFHEIDLLREEIVRLKGETS